MSSIKIDSALVTLTERTLRELLRACEQARAEIPFTDDPMPDGDMATETYIRERVRRGAIRVESNYSAVGFEIHLDGTSVGGGETLGYLLARINESDLEIGVRMLGAGATPLRGTTVHLLHHGKALCGQEGVPREWPRSHCWTQHGHIATCQDCLHQDALDVGL